MKYYQKNLLVLSLAGFLAACSWNQVIPFMPLFMKELGVGASIAAWSGFIFAIQYVAGIIMQPIWGKVADRFGRKPMVIRAGFCLAFVYFGMSLCQAPWQLAVMRFLNGALTGFIPGATALIATNTPEPLAGRYVAITQTASSAGHIAGPAIGGFLALVFTYRSAMRLSGIIVFISTLLVVFLVEERKLVVSTQATSLREDVHLTTKQPVLLLSLGLMFLGTVLSVSLQPLLTLYLDQLSPAGPMWLSGMIFSLPGLAFVLSAYLWSRLGERFSYAKVALWGLYGACVFLLLSSFMSTIGKFAFLYLIYGIFLAAITPSATSIIARDVAEDFRGRAYGMQHAVTNIAGLFAPMLAGAIASKWGLSAAFWSSSTVVLILSSLLWFWQSYLCGHHKLKSICD